MRSHSARVFFGVWKSCGSDPIDTTSRKTIFRRVPILKGRERKAESGKLRAESRGERAESRERRRQEVGSRKRRAGSWKRRVRCMSGELDAECIKQEAESLKRRAGSRMQRTGAGCRRHVYVAHDVMLNLNGARDTTVWRIQEKVFYTDAESRVIRYPTLRKVPPQGR